MQDLEEKQIHIRRQNGKLKTKNGRDKSHQKIFHIGT